jgi:hypothetical protein
MENPKFALVRHLSVQFHQLGLLVFSHVEQHAQLVRNIALSQTALNQEV